MIATVVAARLRTFGPSTELLLGTRYSGPPPRCLPGGSSLRGLAHDLTHLGVICPVHWDGTQPPLPGRLHTPWRGKGSSLRHFVCLRLHASRAFSIRGSGSDRGNLAQSPHLSAPPQPPVSEIRPTARLMTMISANAHRGVPNQALVVKCPHEP